MRTNLCITQKDQEFWKKVQANAQAELAIGLTPFLCNHVRREAGYRNERFIEQLKTYQPDGTGYAWWKFEGNDTRMKVLARLVAGKLGKKSDQRWLKIGAHYWTNR